MTFPQLTDAAPAAWAPSDAAPMDSIPPLSTFETDSSFVSSIASSVRLQRPRRP